MARYRVVVEAAAVIDCARCANVLGQDAVLDRHARVIGRIATAAGAACAGGGEIEAPTMQSPNVEHVRRGLLLHTPPAQVGEGGKVPGELLCGRVGSSGLKLVRVPLRPPETPVCVYQSRWRPASQATPVKPFRSPGKLKTRIGGWWDRNRGSDCGWGRATAPHPRGARPDPSNPRWHLRHHPTASMRRSWSPSTAGRPAPRGEDRTPASLRWRPDRNRRGWSETPR